VTAIVSRGGKAWRGCLIEGSRLEAARAKLVLPAATHRGKIAEAASEHGDSWFVVEGDLPDDPQLAGQTFFTIESGFRRAYPIVAIEKAEGRLRVFTKRGGRGFEARPAGRWELPATGELEIPE
jgi:hypothetical protein